MVVQSEERVTIMKEAEPKWIVFYLKPVLLGSIHSVHSFQHVSAWSLYGKKKMFILNPRNNSLTFKHLFVFVQSSGQKESHQVHQ